METTQYDTDLSNIRSLQKAIAMLQAKQNEHFSFATSQAISRLSITLNSILAQY